MANNLAAAPRLLTVSSLAEFLSTNRDYDIFADAPPVNVDRIAELLGIEVSEKAVFKGPHENLVDTDTVGMITLKEDGGAAVWLNPFENSYLPRRRFTLAHEIGHFCMHRSGDELTFVDNKSTMSRSESYWTRHESEANNFAAELLMPTKLISSVGTSVIDTYKSENGVNTMPFDRFAITMATRFNVSNLAMEYRLKNLGIGKKK